MINPGQIAGMTARDTFSDIGPALLGAALGVILATPGLIVDGTMDSGFKLLSVIVFALAVFSAFHLSIVYLRNRFTIGFAIAFLFYIMISAIFCWRFGGGIRITEGQTVGFALNNPVASLVILFPVVWWIASSVTRRCSELASV